MIIAMTMQNSDNESTRWSRSVLGLCCMRSALPEKISGVHMGASPLVGQQTVKNRA